MKEIKGITCEVKNCVYHDAANRCCAQRIEVGNPNALHESETKCKTFECGDGSCCE